MPKKIRVVTAGSRQASSEKRPRRAVVRSDNPQPSTKLTSNEIRARINRRYATATTLGFGMSRTADTMNSGTNQFYSPQLSTDFLEKPQNLRERRAFYRFFYNTNEIIGQAIDIHSTLPLSKIKLVPPKGKNYDQCMYVYRYFEKMCDDMKLFKTLIEITHEYWLFGNCCSEDTLIRTKEGYKKACDIKVNDELFTHKNRWRPVTRTCSRKADRMFKISCDGLPSVKFTGEHPFEVMTEEGSDKTEFIKVKDLKEGQFIRFVVPKESCSCVGNSNEEKELIDFEDKWRQVETANVKVPVGFHGHVICGSCDGEELISAIQITKIEEIDGGVVYNFEIEEDHTFQASGFSTHNCFIFAEEDDKLNSLNPDDAGNKREESRQRSEFLKKKYKITDKDPLYKGWKKLLVLPPDQVRVKKLPLTDDVAIEYVPDPETKRWITGEQPLYPDQYIGEQAQQYNVPADIQEKVRMSGVIPLDTDPNTGSHVFHFARKKSQYEPLGVSIVERCINTLVLMDKLRQAQTSIASRHMTPMRIVWAEDLSDADVDNLREQVDLALVDPDFSIIANYEIHWEEMGSNGRLLDIEADYEGAMGRLFAGLGVTKEVLTGEGTYTGSRVSLEIMNTQYLLYRELLQEYVENNLFKPVARKKGFVEYDDYGNEVLLYPKLTFTRLAIRDNDQFFDAAFQLYQKGSISIDLILDILNIDPVSTREKIEEGMFTVDDSQFNEVLRNIYANVATQLIETTDIGDKLAKYMNLKQKPAAEKTPGEERFSSVKGNGKIDEEEFKVKMAKLMKYFRGNPKALDRMFQQ